MKRNKRVFIRMVEGGYQMECHACGGVADIKPPMEAWRFVAVMRGFGEEHRYCRAQEKAR